MAHVRAKLKTKYEPNFAKFWSETEADLEEALVRMEKAAREFFDVYAPEGHKIDPRTPTIRGAYYSTIDHANKSVEFGSKARHAYYQEVGGKPHHITGKVKFFWDREGRWWIPGPNLINHPGNPGQHYLEAALEDLFHEFPHYLDMRYRGIFP